MQRIFDRSRENQVNLLDLNKTKIHSEINVMDLATF